MLRLLLVSVCCSLPVLSAAAEPANVAEQVRLFHNILKDIPKQDEPLQRYARFTRAEETLRLVLPKVAAPDRRKLREKLARAFQALPPPDTVYDQYGLAYTRIRWRIGRRDFDAYLSVPVTGEMFARFLTATQASPHRLADYFPLGDIRYAATDGIYRARAASRPVAGLSYAGAYGYASWLSAKRRFGLPSAACLAAAAAGSAWSSNAWQETDVRRRERVEDFGGAFRVLFHDGDVVAELPEASYADVQLRVATSIAYGKQLFLKQLREKE
jgi:hypothetical protein